MHLTPKPLEALIFLIEHRGQVVGKDALLAAVWKDVAVTDGVLVQAVREIRRVLGDDKENPSFVQTVPREGYRFIGSVVSTPAADSSPVEATPSRWLTLRLAGAVVSALLALALWRVWNGTHRAAADSGRSEPPALVAPLTGGDISAVKPVFTPDGRALLYVSDAPENTGVLDLFLMPLNGGSPWRLTRMADAAGDMPVFTADGRDIVFSRYRSGKAGTRVPDLWRVSSLGGPIVRYISEASGAGFSPDGAWVAYTRHAASGRTLVIGPTSRPDDARLICDGGFTPRWSPDGRWIAYTTSYPEGGVGFLWIVSSQLENRRRLTASPSQMYGITWSADSASVIFAAKVGNAFHLWRASLGNDGTEPMTSGVGDYVSPAAARDGRLLAFTQLRAVGDLVIAKLPDATRTRNLTTNEFHRWPRLSPSGRRVASIVQRSSAQGFLYVTDLGSAEGRRMSDVPAAYPSWIDDETVAYIAQSGSGAAIRQVDMRSGDNVTLAELHHPISWLAMRPRLHEAAFVSAQDDQQRLVLRHLLSAEESVLASGAEFEQLRWRPDGGVLAWSGPRVSADARSNGIFVAAPGQKPEHLISDGYAPAWDANGSLFFLRHLGAAAEAGIWRLDAAAGKETQVLPLARLDYLDVAGAALVFSRSSGRSQVFTMTLNPITAAAGR
jgi:Tol biopolymer transport system component